MFVLGMRLKNGKKVKLDMTDKIQNAYEASKNIYDNVLTQGNIFNSFAQSIQGGHEWYKR